LNELVTDALECVPECVEYMKMLKTEEVFRFCAIPQVGHLFALRFVGFCPFLNTSFSTQRTSTGDGNRHVGGPVRQPQGACVPRLYGCLPI
jgi:hypothetical protein